MKTTLAAATVLVVFGLTWGIEPDQPKCFVAPKILKPQGNMPVIGYGTYGKPSIEFQNAVKNALDAGYRHFDSAYVYDTEKDLGKVLSQNIKDGVVKREELFVVSKLPQQGNRPSGVPKYLDRTLSNLGLDYVDLYLIHSPVGFQDSEENLFSGGKKELDPFTDIFSIWKAMEQQVEAGKAKAIGLSNFNITQVKRILEKATIKPAVLQIELNAYYQQKDIVDFCQKNDIVVTAYSPLGSPSKEEGSVTLFDDPTVIEIAKKHKKTEAQVLLRHGIQKGLVVIPKSTNEKRIKQNIDIFDFQLDAEDMKRLNALDKGKRLKWNSMDFLPGTTDHPEFPML